MVVINVGESCHPDTTVTCAIIFPNSNYCDAFKALHSSEIFSLHLYVVLWWNYGSLSRRNVLAKKKKFEKKSTKSYDNTEGNRDK